MRFFALILIQLSFAAFADYKQFHFERALQLGSDFNTSIFWKWAPEGFGLQDETITEGVYEQRLDHDSCCDFTTFKQRYYMDSSLAKGKDAPVFLYICGESTCEKRSLNGAIREHAKLFGAHLVALEHRYYGKSQPFKEMTVENLKYLSTSYALKDLASFVQHFQSELGLSGQVVAFGGSYPGNLSAYFREKLPEVVVGSLASSAPVRAETNFDSYDYHVFKVAGTECAKSVQALVKELESYVGTEKIQEVKKLFNAEVVKDDVDFLYIVADIAAAAVQYGFHKDFCTAVQSKDALKAYGDFAQTVYKKFGMDALHWSMYDGAKNLNPEFYLEGFGMRAWLYQSCKEYGYWQNAYPNPEMSMRSPRINLAYHNALCGRLFGIQNEVDTSYINDFFYKPLLEKKTSRIVMTNGTNDPWSNLSVLEPQGNGVRVYRIEGAAHCDDLRAPKPTDSDSLKNSRTLLVDSITEWLHSKEQHQQQVGHTF